MKMNYSKVIAIDGPSGSGKSTIAKMVAAKLGSIYIDTGAMFRGIGLHLNEKNISVGEIEQISRELDHMKFEYGRSDDDLITIDGRNLTSDIRQHHVSDIASRYSKIPLIREYLKNFQQELGEKKSCVMEGRDIGTVIFPNSYCKIFLTATDEVRAHRRQKQLAEKGESVSIEQLLKDIKQRDERDSQRELAPLIKASDATEILTDHYTIDEVIEKILEIEQSLQARVS